MTSRQSSKSELAEAGRRKLEAFRKQKAQSKRPRRDASSHTAEAETDSNSSAPPRAAATAKEEAPSQRIQDSDGPIPFGDAAGSKCFLGSTAFGTSEGHGSLPKRDPPRLPPPLPVFKRPPAPPTAFKQPPVQFAKPPPAPVQERKLPLQRRPSGELPVSSRASDLHDSPGRERADSLTSPLPNGYAALSDSYLSPSKPGKPDEAEDLSGPASPREQSPHAASPAAASPKSPRSSSFSRFTKLFSRTGTSPPTPQPEPAATSFSERLRAPAEAAELAEGTTASVLGDSHGADSRARGPASEPVPLLRGKHGRVPSLNAWNEHTQPARTASGSSESESDSVRQLVPGPTVGEESAGGAPTAGFNFSRLPEPSGSLRAPLWQSAPPGNRGSEPAADTAAASDSSRKYGAAGLLQRDEEATQPEGLSRVPDARAGALANGTAKPWESALAGGGKPFADDSIDSLQQRSDEFATLQQHIGELTDQKFELARGLERQQEVAASLAAENQRLLDDYNQQGQLIQHLRKQLDERASEIGAQRIALQGLGGERDACRAAVQDTSQQAQDLATEVVGLEEKFLKARSAELLASRRAERAESEAKRAERQAAALTAECRELKSMVSALQEEKQVWRKQLEMAATGHGQKPEQNGASSLDSKTTELQAPEVAIPRTPPRVSKVKESEVTRIVSNAWQQASSLSENGEAGPAEGSLEGLQLLLPPRQYLGGGSQEAAELAAEERKVLGSIHTMLEALRKEREALLISFSSQMEQCQQLQISNSSLRKQLELAGLRPAPSPGLTPNGLAKHTTTETRRPAVAQRRGPIGWFASVVAPKPIPA